MRDAGIGGNVLINEKADRFNSYNVWDYAEGQESYRNINVGWPHAASWQGQCLICPIIFSKASA